MTARIHHADLWGSRKVKYDWLNNHDVNDTHWQTVQPQEPFYLFVPQDNKLLPEYQSSFLVTKVFNVYASTVTTGRNHFSMSFDRDSLLERVNDLMNPTISDESIKCKYELMDVSYWTVAEARKEIQSEKNTTANVHEYCYRPFDFRFVYYHSAICERLRSEIMRHMFHDNLAFLTHRPQSPGEFTFAYCTNQIGDQCVAANKSAGGGNSFQFPLYVYPHPGKMLESSPWPAGKDGRRPNLSPEFVKDFAGKLGLEFVPDGQGDLKKTFGPEDVFHYAYAVFHSPTYRSRYAAFLKIDFPRLPLTGDKKLFARLCELGAELVGLHLLERVPAAQATYPRQGGNLVDKPRYKPPAEQAVGRVYVNDQQYFEPVPPEVWDFHVGGYQVCQKWLKDRKDRALSYDDIEHYRRMTEAVRQTLRLMDEIDRAIPAWPLT